MLTMSMDVAAAAAAAAAEGGAEEEGMRLLVESSEALRERRRPRLTTTTTVAAVVGNTGETIAETAGVGLATRNMTVSRLFLNPFHLLFYLPANSYTFLPLLLFCYAPSQSRAVVVIRNGSSNHCSSSSSSSSTRAGAR